MRACVRAEAGCHGRRRRPAVASLLLSEVHVKCVGGAGAERARELGVRGCVGRR